MSKIYKIDDAEFEELIKTIALNNESIIENNDPVLMFYTIAKYKIETLISLKRLVLSNTYQAAILSHSCFL